MHRKYLAALTLGLSAVLPAGAQEIMTASTAQSFVAGKLFSYSCFDGTEGSGKIFADGSAVGTIRPMGRGDLRHMQLPAGTLFIQNDRVCASIRGLPFQPCFNLTKTSETGFVGSISGLSFMYCEFERGTPTQLAARRRAPRMELRGILAGASPGVP
ncbi:MAG TPA: hypothetical protein VK877_07570 [Pseudolabrys sp.]|nr:hypothetical protein [Pseudolabrys sp.]